MININDALNIVIQETKVLDSEKKDILSCLNKVLAEDIYSKDNLPPFDKSAMDGYAIRSEDTKDYSIDNIIELEVKGVIKAGSYCNEELSSGTAFKIMTGAPIPKGADAVIEIEKVKTEENKLYISEVVKSGNHIIKLGEEITSGQLALEKGKVIRPVEIGFLASLGYSSIKVYKSPVVALIITGDELVDIDSSLEKGKIRNSNEYSLKALISNLQGEVLSLGIVSDNKEILTEKVKYALEKADIVISSGGASVGDYDFIEDILKELGADIKFNSVAIKPGKPATFATYKNKLYFSLPGNPLSLITTFEQLVKPAIEKMMGKRDLNNEEIPVVLTSDFKTKIGRRNYIYIELRKENGAYYAYKLGSQSSSALMTMSKANGLIIVPEECGEVKAGEILSGKFIFE
ncbi:gephyrin-like molybdotransferase Glp [Clostridium sp. DJ247]|uniref:molybdopterin molybdotransferase MoeA n=1 Tax=Clostridium sp. DJ247 TaxID=2726188 RepID=UPI0016267B16|nr:gephyrin-like molybdotransferase Glp [Clostridium sp. DJ247]MBC2582352.1 molybdopterin molybdotransferase MoeA [Clostridium sp. DJ247]